MKGGCTMTAKSMDSKILVVDDDSDVVFDLGMWLTKEGFTVHDVGVGQAAIQRYNMYRPYAAVVLDLHMPKVDGFEVLKQVKKTDANAKVVVLTGDASARDRAVALGADVFVVKPVRREAFCKLVGRVARRARNAA